LRRSQRVASLRVMVHNSKRPITAFAVGILCSCAVVILDVMSVEHVHEDFTMVTIPASMSSLQPVRRYQRYNRPTAVVERSCFQRECTNMQGRVLCHTSRRGCNPLPQWGQDEASFAPVEEHVHQVAPEVPVRAMEHAFEDPAHIGRLAEALGWPMREGGQGQLIEGEKIELDKKKLKRKPKGSAELRRTATSSQDKSEHKPLTAAAKERIKAGILKILGDTLEKAKAIEAKGKTIKEAEDSSQGSSHGSGIPEPHSNPFEAKDAGDGDAGDGDSSAEGLPPMIQRALVKAIGAFKKSLANDLPGAFAKSLTDRIANDPRIMSPDDDDDSKHDEHGDDASSNSPFGSDGEAPVSDADLAKFLHGIVDASGHAGYETSDSGSARPSGEQQQPECMEKVCGEDHKGKLQCVTKHGCPDLGGLASGGNGAEGGDAVGAIRALKGLLGHGDDSPMHVVTNSPGGVPALQSKEAQEAMEKAIAREFAPKESEHSEGSSDESGKAGSSDGPAPSLKYDGDLHGPTNKALKGKGGNSDRMWWT